MSSPAYAQAAASTQHQFDIPAQPLREALLAFGAQSGFQVTAEGPLVEGRTSASVSGDIAPVEALSRLLAGTGLTFRFDGRDAVRIESAPQGTDGAINLRPVRVEGVDGSAGDASPPYSVIGSLPPTRAGGQVAGGGNFGALGNVDYQDVPYSGGSYTETFIKDRLARTVIDTLLLDPAISLRGSGVGPITSDFRVRGWDSSIGDGNFNGLPGINSFNPQVEAFERVEVLRGASGALTGSGGYGGLINLRPKRAENEPVTQVDGTFASRSHFGGHLDVGRRFGEGGQFGARVNVTFRDGDLTLRGLDTRYAAAAAAFDIRTERFRASLDFQYDDTRQFGSDNGIGISDGVAIPRTPSRTRPIAPGAGTYTTTNKIVAARTEYDLGSDLTLGAAAGRLYQYGGGVLGGCALIDNAGNLSCGYGTGPYRRRNDSAEATVRGSVSTGPLKHSFAFGATYYYGNAFVGDGESGPEITSNLYTPTTFPDQNFRRLTATPTPYNASRQYTAFITDQISILDEAASITLGIRRVWLEYLSGNASGRGFSLDDSQVAWTPTYALVVKPSAHLSLYASHVEGFAPGGVAPPETANAGEQFPPSRTKQTEIGAKLDYDTFGMTLSAYRTNAVNEFVNRQVVPPRYEQNGLIRHQGIEFSINAMPVPSVRLLGSITLSKAKLLRTEDGLLDGHFVAGVPRHQMSFNGEWDTPFVQSLTLTGSLIHSGRVPLNFVNDRYVDAWTRVDLGARYVFAAAGHDMTLRVIAENAFDENYWIGSGDNGLALSGPRTIRASFAIAF